MATMTETETLTKPEKPVKVKKTKASKKPKVTIDPNANMPQRELTNAEKLAAVFEKKDVAEFDELCALRVRHDTPIVKIDPFAKWDAPPPVPESPKSPTIKKAGGKPELSLFIESRDYFLRLLVDNHVFPGKEESPLSFLDLGASPGGFSTAVMRHFPAASGIGLSLSRFAGGYASKVESRFLESGQYEQLWVDLNTCLTPEGALSYPPTLADPLFSPSTSESDEDKFDLVIADCHSLRKSHEIDCQRLWAGQLFTAFKGLKLGGTLISKLFTLEKPMSLLALWMFKESFKSVKLYKASHPIHRRPHFYAIAEGYKPSQKMNDWLEGIKGLWHKSLYGGVAGEGLTYSLEDWNFVAGMNELQSSKFVDWIVDKGRPIWQNQAQLLRGHMEKKKMADCTDIPKSPTL